MPLADIGIFDTTAWEKRIPRNCLVDRDATIVDLCTGKTVLHLGAADAPFHREKAASGDLLHQKVRKVASRTVGIDQDQEAVKFLREEFGITDILLGDAAGSAAVTSGEEFDVVLCCDVIEHTCNPGGLLDFCISQMSSETVLLLTTANAASIKVALRAILGREAVHFDHVAYYSFGTLCRLLRMKELIPSQFGTFSYQAVTRFAGILFRIVARLTSACADGIMVTAIRPGSR